MGVSQILPSLSDGICLALSQMPSDVLRRLTELRIRRDKPLILVLGSKSYFITKNGKLVNHITSGIYIVENEELELIFKRLCNYSVHCEIDNLKNGFITALGGNRVGVCSTAVVNDGKLTSVKDISSLNIRISKEIKDCAKPIMNMLYINELPSIIVAAPPAGGKTTFLRDFARLISGGYNNSFKKTVIIDERNEIACKSSSGILADVGINTDVITGFSKKKGIEMAIRTLSPEIIICDEISSLDEAEEIIDGFHCGVSFAVSVHAKNREDLLSKRIIKKLVSEGEFDYIVLLNDYTNDFEILDVRKN